MMAVYLNYFYIRMVHVSFILILIIYLKIFE